MESNGLKARGRRRKYGDQLAESVRCSIDPALKRDGLEHEIDFSKALSIGVKFLLKPEMLSLEAERRIEEAERLRIFGKEQIQSNEVNEELQRANPLVIEFLQTHGRNLRDVDVDFWMTGSSGFDGFQRKVKEYVSNPRIAERLQSAKVSEDNFAGLITLHLSK